MTKQKSDLDGWVLPVIITGSIIGGLTLGYYVVPQIIKLINPPKPEPKNNPNPETPKEEPKRLGPVYMVEEPPESQRIGKIQPKYLHSSAKKGEENRQISKIPQQSYRFQMSGKENIEQKPRWHVIE